MEQMRQLLLVVAVVSVAAPALASDEQDCFQGQQPQQRIEGCSALIQRAPKDATVYHNRAVAHGLAGDVDSAIADYSKAIEIEPSNASAYDNRGRAYAMKGDHARAAEDQTKAEELMAKAIGQPTCQGRRGEQSGHGKIPTEGQSQGEQGDRQGRARQRLGVAAQSVQHRCKADRRQECQALMRVATSVTRFGRLRPNPDDCFLVGWVKRSADPTQGMFLIGNCVGSSLTLDPTYDYFSSAKTMSRCLRIMGAATRKRRPAAISSITSEIGRVTNTVKSPRDRTRARRRFSSSSGPRI